MGCSFGKGDGFVDGWLRNDLATCERQYATVLCTFAAQVARQLPGVNIGYRYRTFLDQILRQSHGHAKVGCQQRQVFDDQPRGINFFRFDVFSIDTVVANVRVSQCYQLLEIAGVGQDFLVARHGGIENHLANCVSRSTNRVANKDSAVCQRQNGVRVCL